MGRVARALPLACAVFLAALFAVPAFTSPAAEPQRTSLEEALATDHRLFCCD